MAFLTNLIKQTEEVAKIELEKKALMKHAHDQTVSKNGERIAHDALRMSMAKLNTISSQVIMTYKQTNKMDSNTFQRASPSPQVVEQ